MNIKDLVKVTALGALVASTSAMAADGPMSSVSSAATSQVRGQIPDRIRITGLGGADDLLDMGSHTYGSGDMVAQESFCVYRNSATRQYGITIVGDGGLTAGNEFQIDNGTVEIDYTVGFTDDDSNAVANLATNTLLSAQTADDHPTCDAGVTAAIEVRVAAAVADAAQVGVYTGNLTVTVVPE